MVRVGQDCEGPQVRQQLPDQLDALLRQFQRQERASGEIPPRPGQALGDAELDGIATDGE